MSFVKIWVLLKQLKRNDKSIMENKALLDELIDFIEPYARRG